MRRTFLSTIGVVAAAVLIVAALGASPAAAEKKPKPSTTEVKTALCHYEADTDTYKLHHFKTNAAAAHQRHGDVGPGEPVPGSNGDFKLGQNCEVVPVDSDGDGVVNSLDECPETPPGTVVDEQGCPLDVVLAGAYTNGLLVAELIDRDGDGIPSAGDEIFTGVYPLNFDDGSTGNFTDNHHTVLSVDSNCADNRLVRLHVDGDGGYVEFNRSGSQEKYSEKDAYQTVIRDGFTSAPDQIEAARSSTSKPDTRIYPTMRRWYNENPDLSYEGDQEFLDIELNFTCT